MAQSDDNKVILQLLNRLLDGMDNAKDSINVVDSKIGSLDKKVDLHIQKTEIELNKINELDLVQNTLLDQHIEGVNTLKKMLDLQERDFTDRLRRIEEPKVAFRVLKKWIVRIGSFATAVAAVVGLAKLLNLF